MIIGTHNAGLYDWFKFDSMGMYNMYIDDGYYYGTTLPSLYNLDTVGNSKYQLKNVQKFLRKNQKKERNHLKRKGKNEGDLVLRYK